MLAKDGCIHNGSATDQGTKAVPRYNRAISNTGKEVVLKPLMLTRSKQPVARWVWGRVERRGRGQARHDLEGRARLQKDTQLIMCVTKDQHPPLPCFSLQQPPHTLYPRRMPGIGIVYCESQSGLPPVLVHLLDKMPALYEATIFVTLRFVPIPHVSERERYLVGGAWGSA
jgi:hypothetical protein